MKKIIFYVIGLTVAVILVFLNYQFKHNEDEATLPAEIIEIKNNIRKENELDIPVPGSLAKTKEEALVYLNEYKKNSNLARDIVDNSPKIPEALIKLAANRPKSMEFVYGYLENKNTSKRIEGRPYESVELGRKFPLYLLWDKRWGYREYENLFCVLGCGPTTAAMAINGYGGETNPLEQMDIFLEKGYYIRDIGTSWEGIRKSLASYGIESKDLPTVEKKYREHLDTGNPILISVEPSKFTNIGHYMLIVGYNENGFLLNDSNSINYSKEEISFDELSKIIKGAWTLYKN